MFLAINASLPVQAQATTYDITLTFNEPMTQPENSIFVGSFNYNAANPSYPVTGLSGQLSEAMTGPGTTPYNPSTGPGVSDGMTWLSLNNQLPNGGTAQTTYEWQANGGTYATVFLQNYSSTFATSYNGATGDGWSPQGGIAVDRKAPSPNNGNAYALIFVPNDLSSANPVDLVWNEGTGTGSQGLEYTAYADYTSGGLMGSVGMTGTSALAYGAAGTMYGSPLSETISAVSSVPEPSTWGLLVGATGMLGLLIGRKQKS